MEQERIPMKGGFYKLPTLLAAGGYRVVSSLITEKNFQTEQRPSEYEIVLLSYTKKVNTNEVLADAFKMKLSRPTATDAFMFGAQHPHQQMLSKVVFFHEAFIWSGFMFYLALDCEKGERTIHPVSGGDWYEGVRFAFTKNL